jgi:hypothetical protein
MVFLSHSEVCQDVTNYEPDIYPPKIYMTYPALKLSDGQILDVLAASRKNGVTTMVHCEVCNLASELASGQPFVEFHTDWLPRTPKCKSLAET